MIPTHARRAASLALIGLLTVASGACSSSAQVVEGAAPDTGSSGTEDPEWAPGEEVAVLACASDKLGYELTSEVMSAETPTDGVVDTEAEWEEQRWMRAYEQCAFELPVSVVDMDDMGWQIAYRHAYALDPDGEPTMEDPLAPWPGREGAW